MAYVDLKGTRRTVLAVVLVDAAAASAPARPAGTSSSPEPTAPRPPAALPVRTLFVPASAAAGRVEELALTDITVLGKGRIKLEPPRTGDRLDARELASVTQQLLDVAQQSALSGGNSRGRGMAKRVGEHASR